jgi:hypothetical protein
VEYFFEMVLNGLSVTQVKAMTEILFLSVSRCLACVKEIALNCFAVALLLLFNHCANVFDSHCIRFAFALKPLCNCFAVALLLLFIFMLMFLCF